MTTNVLNTARQDWAEEPRTLQAIEQVLAVLKSLNPSATRFITPDMVNHVIKNEKLDFEVIRTVFLYLASERMDLLRLHFAIHDEQHHQWIDLPPRDVRRALAGQQPLINPESGEEVSDPRHDVVMYFEGTDQLVRMIVEAK